MRAATATLGAVRLVLASSSPRRLDLLRQIGIEPTVDPADVDEIHQDLESAEAHTERLALSKAEVVARRHPAGHCVLAADTVVVCDEVILGKPIDASDARRMMRRLAGRAHRVVTGVAVVVDGRSLSTTVETGVTFDRLTDDDIDDYVATGEPLDKAGAYGLQGAASMFVVAVEGPVDNVIGLPRRAALELLSNLGVDPHELRTLPPALSAD